MKTNFIRISICFLIAGTAFTSCRHSRVVYNKPGVGNSSKLPPGQATKSMAINRLRNMRRDNKRNVDFCVRIIVKLS